MVLLMPIRVRATFKSDNHDGVYVHNDSFSIAFPPAVLVGEGDGGVIVLMGWFVVIGASGDWVEGDSYISCGEVAEVRGGESVRFPVSNEGLCELLTWLLVSDGHGD